MAFSDCLREQNDVGADLCSRSSCTEIELVRRLLNLVLQGMNISSRDQRRPFQPKRLLSPPQAVFPFGPLKAHRNRIICKTYAQPMESLVHLQLAAHSVVLRGPNPFPGQANHRSNVNNCSKVVVSANLFQRKCPALSFSGAATAVKCHRHKTAHCAFTAIKL